MGQVHETHKGKVRGQKHLVGGKVDDIRQSLAAQFGIITLGQPSAVDEFLPRFAHARNRAHLPVFILRADLVRLEVQRE